MARMAVSQTTPVTPFDKGLLVSGQSKHRLEKNFQTQSISEGSEFIKSKEQR